MKVEVFSHLYWRTKGGTRDWQGWTSTECSPPSEDGARTSPELPSRSQLEAPWGTVVRARLAHPWGWVASNCQTGGGLPTFISPLTSTNRSVMERTMVGRWATSSAPSRYCLSNPRNRRLAHPQVRVEAAFGKLLQQLGSLGPDPRIGLCPKTLSTLIQRRIQGRNSVATGDALSTEVAATCHISSLSHWSSEPRAPARYCWGPEWLRRRAEGAVYKALTVRCNYCTANYVTTPVQGSTQSEFVLTSISRIRIWTNKTWAQDLWSL